MNTEELKQTISNKVGIPANLLTGNTDQEIIEQARQLLTFKADAEQKQPAKLSTSEQFARWISGEDADTEQNKALSDLNLIADSLQGYPTIIDRQVETGERNPLSGATTQESFENWFKAKTAYSPFMG